MKTPDAYNAEEMVDLLKARQAGMTQRQFAAEIGISMQLLSEIYSGNRSVGNAKVLEYLAGKGKEFIHRDVWVLVPR